MSADRDAEQHRQEAGSPVALTLAGNLRALRGHEGLTLVELATRAGIGKSTLAQLESGRGNPSIETVFALSVALGVPVGRLLWAPPPVVRVVRRREGIALDSSNHMFRSELLARAGRHGDIEIYSIELQTGGVRIAEPHVRGAVEHLLVCAGRMRVGPVDQAAELAVGDFISFQADVPHRYEALGGPALAMGLMDHTG